MGRILVRGEPGHDIIPALAPLADEPVIDKPGKGAFYQTDLELMLRNRGIETLLVCGVTTEVCVHTTMREANDRGFRCLVLADACASYFPDFHEAGLAMIKRAGRHLRLGVGFRRLPRSQRMARAQRKFQFGIIEGGVR
jgi:nicotinamidase-related amidase